MENKNMDEVQSFEVPQQVIIDGLRNEVARLNDERLSMSLKLQFANQVIDALKHQLAHAESHDHEHDAGEEVISPTNA